MGFGICAFTYYRRIVENHKNELFDKFIEVAEEEHLATDKIDALRHARDHTEGVGRGIEWAPSYKLKDFANAEVQPDNEVDEIMPYG